ncbi:hypothetical protein PMIT1327_00536 [Prochlorococcus marinus str. MIT 1327]|nr:hypothetical protein PMIT1327_00536 [Prochlorococcus marinus str. MIT 1327]
MRQANTSGVVVEQLLWMVVLFFGQALNLPLISLLILDRLALMVGHLILSISINLENMFGLIMLATSNQELKGMLSTMLLIHMSPLVS